MPPFLEEVEGARRRRLRSTFLGSPCTARAGANTVNGVLLEVRRLWLPPLALPASSRGRRHSEAVQRNAEPQNGPLYGFVRVKDVDHRVSGWFPLHGIYVKYSRGLLPDRWRAAAAAAAAAAATCSSHRDPQPPCSAASPEVEGSLPPPPSRGCSTRPDWLDGAWEDSALDDEVLEGPASDVITAPLLSTVYAEVTPGMARTRRAKKPLDYLEERLLRDCQTPTTIRFFVYADRYVFQPWYYAPYGLLHREYDPLLPTPAPVKPDGPPRMDPEEEEAVAWEDRSTPGSPVGQPSPYIKDAYLCPFSLRVFSTYDQLRHESEQYRGERLRPPGCEIYRDDLRGVSCFEVNGSHRVTYCRHLFLLGKSFLENKLAGHDVHNYYFYVVCLHERYLPGYLDPLTGPPGTAGPRASPSRDPAWFFAGFFTWEKRVSECNLACIVTLPCFAGTNHGQHGEGDPAPPPPPPKGIGQLMVSLSYALAYRRRQVGSPERPLSDLGAAAYQRFWQRTLVKWLYHRASRLLPASLTASAGASPSQPIAVGLSSDALEEEEEEDEDDDGVVVVDDGVARGVTPGGAKRGRSTGTVRAAAAVVRGRRSARGRIGRRRTAEDAGDGAENGKGSTRPSSPDASTRSSADTDDEAEGSTDPVGEIGRRASRKGGPTSRRPASASRAAAATTTTPPPPPPALTIQEIAEEVGLEAQDVLRAMLGMGLLHRSSEDRSTRLVIPEAFLRWEYHRIAHQERSPLYCAFDPALLVDIKGSASATHHARQQ